jgi:hypothetical protein
MRESTGMTRRRLFHLTLGKYGRIRNGLERRDRVHPENGAKFNPPVMARAPPRNLAKRSPPPW